MELNGEINTAHDSLTRGLSEIKKLWETGEVRLSAEEVSDKRNTLKETVLLAEEIAAVLGKFDIISK